MIDRGRSTRSDREESSRGTSIALGYVLVLSISAVLVSGLILAGGSFVDDQRERVIEGELNVIGTHLAGNVEQVDRYVNASEGSEPVAQINQTFQRQVTGESYEVELVPPDGDGPAQLVLTPRQADVTVRVNASVSDEISGDIESSKARGGTISVYYDGDDDTLVIQNA